MTDRRSSLWDAELVGGPEQRDIVLAPYDPQWPTIFEEHKDRILGALRGEAKRVEHVGSTSVPGLVAKPTIDIQISVTDPEHEPSYVPPLQDAGYILRVREAGHRMLRTPTLDVHVHVCGVGSAWERRHLLFRDWLRRSDSDRSLYASTKAALAERRWPTTNHYADAKTTVIAEVMERAEAWAAGGAWPNLITE